MICECSEFVYCILIDFNVSVRYVLISLMCLFFVFVYLYYIVDYSGRRLFLGFVRGDYWMLVFGVMVGDVFWFVFLFLL